MFSINRRWFMAYQTGLLKARGHRKGQNRFWPVAAGQKRQKLAGCSSLPFPSPPLCCALLCSAHSAIHLSTQQDCARINKSVQDPPSLPLFHLGVT